jgi:hypothetical protein
MSSCLRTTVRLDGRLLRAAKAYAAESGLTLTAVIDDELREVLARRGRPCARSRITLTTVGGSGTYPRVDLNDSSALWDLLVGRD